MKFNTDAVIKSAYRLGIAAKKLQET
ncbi:hypothetical protein LCGC14_1887000, partial [marine sediment metagenome]